MLYKGFGRGGGGAPLRSLLPPFPWFTPRRAQGKRGGAAAPSCMPRCRCTSPSSWLVFWVFVPLQKTGVGRGGPRLKRKEPPHSDEKVRRK